MFLTGMTGQQQDAFFEVAWRLLAVDGVTDEEVAAIAQLRAQLSRPARWTPDPSAPLPGLLEPLAAPGVRQAALLELLGLAYADAVFGPEERAFIGDCATSLGTTPAWLRRAEDWVCRQLALGAEAAALLEEH